MSQRKSSLNSASLLARSLIFCSCLAMGTLPATTTMAREPSLTAYQAAIHAAVRELEEGNFAEAHASFEQAHRLQPSARTFRGLGIVAFEMRRYVDAERELAAALKSKTKPLTVQQRAQARVLLTRTQSYVGTLVVDVTPELKTILVDQQLTPLSPDKTVRLNLGSHLIEVQADGHKTVQRRLRIRGGQDHPLSLRLKPLSNGQPERIDLTRTTDQALQAQQDDSSAISSPWLWTGVGLVVAGAAVGLTLALSGTKDQPEAHYGGNTAIVLEGP